MKLNCKTATAIFSQRPWLLFIICQSNMLWRIQLEETKDIIISFWVLRPSDSILSKLHLPRPECPESHILYLSWIVVLRKEDELVHRQAQVRTDQKRFGVGDVSCSEAMMVVAGRVEWIVIEFGEGQRCRRGEVIHGVVDHEGVDYIFCAGYNSAYLVELGFLEAIFSSFKCKISIITFDYI